MGILNWLTRFTGKAEARAYTTLDLANDVGWNNHLWSSADIRPSNAMQSIAIMRCVTILSGIMASFPVDFYRRANGRRDEVDHQADWLLNWEPNPDQDAQQFREQMMTNLLLSGNCCARKVYDGNRILALWPIPWETVTWKKKNGSVTYEVYDGGAQKEYQDRDIFRVSLLSLDGLHGLSPIEQTRLRLTAHSLAEQHQGRVYQNRAMPGLIMVLPETVGPEKAADLKKSLQEQLAKEEAMKSLVIGGGAKVELPTIPLVDLQYVESLQYGEEQIARLYGVPPHILGLTSKQSNWGTGIEQQNIGFMQYTLLPLATKWEKAARRQLFTFEEKRSKIFVKHNMAAILRGDLKSQAEALTLYTDKGVLLHDEAREMLDRNPLPGGVGSKPYMQSQMLPMDMLGEQVQAPAAQGADV